jgi:DNA-binding ferritin-like protein
MAVAITYSLAVNQRNSDAYYQRVREFTDEVLERAAESLMPSVIEFTEYLRTSRLEEPRTDESTSSNS